MKKFILSVLVFATPWIASAAQDYTLTLPQQEISAEAPSLDTQATQYRRFNFGRVWVGERRTADFVLGAGNFPLRVHGMNVWGRYYDADTNCPSVLFPGQRCVIRISYWPGQPGYHDGRMTLWVANDQVVVDLFGQAIGRRR